MNFIGAMNMRTLFFLAIMIFILKVANAQSRVIYSLKAEVFRISENDRFQVYIALGIELQDINNEEAATYAARAYAISKGDSLKYVRSGLVLAQTIREIDPDSSLTLLYRILPIARQMKMDRRLYIILNTIGINYLFRGKYDQALRFFLQCLELPYVRDAAPARSKVLNNLGLLYYKILNYRKALSYYDRSLAAMQSTGDSSILSLYWSNKSLCYSYLRRLDSASYCLNQARIVLEKFPTVEMKIGYDFAAGILSMNRGSLADAEENFQNCRIAANGIGHVRFQLSALEKLATVHLIRGEMEKAKIVLCEADSLGFRAKLIAEMKEIYKVYVAYYRNLRNYRLLAAYQDRYIQATDSLNSEAQRNKLIDLEIEAKEAEYTTRLELQRALNESNQRIVSSQRWLSFSIGTIALLLAILFIIAIRLYQNKNKSNVLLERNLSLRTEQLRDKYREAEINSRQQKTFIDKRVGDAVTQTASLQAIIEIIPVNQGSDEYLRHCKSVLDALNRSLQDLRLHLMIIIQSELKSFFTLRTSK